MKSKRQFDIPGESPLRSLFAQLFDSMLWVDEFGNILQAEQKTDILLGIPSNPSENNHFFEIAPLLTLIEWKKHWKRLKKNESICVQTEVLAAGHTLLPSKLHLSYCPDQVAFVGIIASHSEPREKALQKLLKYQFASGWWEWNLLTQQFKCSRYTADLLQIEDTAQYSSTDAINALLESRLSKDQHEQLKIRLNQALKKKSGFTIAVNIERKPHLVKAEVLTSSLRPFLIMGTIKQLKEDSKGEDEPLKQPAAPEAGASEMIETLREGLNIINTPVFLVDEQENISLANAYAKEMLGAGQQTLAGKPLSAIFSGVDLSRMAPVQQATVNLPDSGVTELEVKIKPWNIAGDTYHILAGNPEATASENEEALREAQEKIKGLTERLKEENLFLKRELSANYNFNNIITRSPSYRQVLSQVAQVADTDATVLIMGETGTGKELLARAIHSFSEREEGPMIKVNCAALPKNLIESELFGHEKGSFTGAEQQRKGRFELADQGTIFLDEIGELPLSLQSNLLRVLQEGEFERVGGTETIKVDTRVIAATNRDLRSMVEEGEFREDLYYRLNVFPIKNLPLRERRDDIPVLVEHFTRKYNKKFGKNVEKVSKADLKKLVNYDFPGNIRELENIVERAIILSPGKKLNLQSNFLTSGTTNIASADNNNFLSFEAMQKKHILEALEKTKWRVTGPNGAARLLKLNDRTLMSKMRRLNIKREDYI